MHTTPSINDYHDAEVDAAERIRRERLAAAIEDAICATAFVVCAVIFILALACA